MQQKETIKKLMPFLPLIAVISIFTFVLVRANKDGSNINNPTVQPVQEVFKPTDTIRFMLDLGENPSLSHNLSIPHLTKVHAETTGAYSEGDLTISAKITSTITGEELPLPLEISKESDTTYIIEGENDQYSLVPGKYKVEVDVQQGGTTQTYTQDFNWGVLALNTNKSIYTPHETAIIAMAVLDEEGEMVCDAEVVLEITDPSGKTTILSTGSEIIVNPNCSMKAYIEEPDYETAYKVGASGKYKMILTATTPNGAYTIHDSFEVRDYVPFDIERKTATRIYPPVNYPVTIIIKANEDFSGVIEEKIPGTFSIISSQSGLVQRKMAEDPPAFGLVQNAQYSLDTNTVKVADKGAYKILSWEVDLKKGEEYQLQYTYKAPDISPEFYLLGPLKLIDQNLNEIFSEIRQWQIAADAIAYVNSNSYGYKTLTSVSTSLTAAANNLVVFFCNVQANVAITGPGVGWTQVFNESGTLSQGAWYKISAGALEAPSCSWTGAQSATAMILEYSGVELTTEFIIDTSASATGSGDTTVECPSVTPSAGNHVYISALIYSDGGTSQINSWSNTFTERQQPQVAAGGPSGRMVGAVADKITTGTQSTVATADGGGGNWRCQTLAFNEESDFLTGRVYTDDDEVTPINSQSVCAVYNNGTPVCDTTNAGGDFVIGFDGTAGTAGDQLTFYLDGGVNFGNTITVHDGGDIMSTDNLRVYEDHVVTRYEQGTDLSIVDMDAYDNDQNATDMLFDAEDLATDTLSIEDGNELFVQNGYTFAPTGNITSSHDIEIDGTWTAAASETINLSGSFKLDSTGTLTPSTSTITFDGTAGTEDIITTGTGGFYDLVINDGGTGSGLTVEVEDPLIVQNNLTITGGTLDTVTGEGNQINVGNNWDNDDTFQARTGTVVMDGSGATTYTIDADGPGTDAFYSIAFNDNNGGATYQFTNFTDIDGGVTITGGTLDPNGFNLTVGGGWTNDDIFLEGTTRVTFDGGTAGSIDSGCADETSCTNENFYDLTIDKSAGGTSINLSNTHLRVTNALTLTTGTLNQGSSNVQVEGTTAITIGSSGMWSNLSSGNITLGGTLTNSGGVTLNGDGASCGGDDSILLRSTAAVQRAWNGSGTFNIIDTDVQYQAGTANIDVQSGTDSGNNGSNWKIFDGCYTFGFNSLLLESLLFN